jgi:hypothetical protein
MGVTRQHQRPTRLIQPNRRYLGPEWSRGASSRNRPPRLKATT